MDVLTAPGDGQGPCPWSLTTPEMRTYHDHEWGFPVADATRLFAASTALSRDLRRRGWRFVGPTTVVAFMQAARLVNDHRAGRPVRPLVEDRRRLFAPPR